MNEKLPSREHALHLLRENGCSVKVIEHCQAVAELALETAKTLRRKGFSVDLKLVEVGALLHDVGRSRTHGVNHAIEGAKIAKSANLPRTIISVIERHVGGGITTNEARELGWPSESSYVPVTLEEKIVSFADKLVEGPRRVSVELEIEELSNEGKPEAADRVRKLHDEMEALIGDCP